MATNDITMAIQAITMATHSITMAPHEITMSIHIFRLAQDNRFKVFVDLTLTHDQNYQNYPIYHESS